jgi:hypothetical protein
VPVDSRFPGLYIACGARLNFYEAKNIGIPSDEVNLSPAARRAEVSRHHYVAQLPQMKVSRLFPPPPGAMMCRNLFPPATYAGQASLESEEPLASAGPQRCEPRMPVQKAQRNLQANCTRLSL